MGFRNNKTINYQGENLFVASGQEEESTPHEWDGMPEFNQPEAEAWKMVMVRFRNEEDLLEFGKRLEQTVTKKTKSIWFPALDKKANSLLRYIGEDQMEDFDIDEIVEE